MNAENSQTDIWQTNQGLVVVANGKEGSERVGETNG